MYTVYTSQAHSHTLSLTHKQTVDIKLHMDTIQTHCLPTPSLHHYSNNLTP